MDHQYCLFYKNNRLQFGWIQEIRKNKLVVIPENGKEFNCSAKQTELIWKGKEYSDPKEALLYLKKQSEWVVAEKGSIDLSVIHELCESDKAYSIDDLAADFLDDPENSWSKVALLLALKDSHYLFQQKKEQFFARSEEDIKRLKEQDQKQKEQELRQHTESDWTDALLSGVTPDITSDKQEHWTQFLSRLEKFVIYQESSQEQDYFYKLLHLNSKDPMMVDRKLISVLKTAGVAISWGKLMLRRSSAVPDFSEEEQRAAVELKKSDLMAVSDFETRDQRELETYTVDNAETKDFDDALSFERTEKGVYIRIHITDVASFIDRSHLLFKTSEQKISSIYTIKEIIPMLPTVLSEDYFSLKEGVDRTVVTYEIFIDKNEKEHTAIYRSLINVNRNLSYLEVDQFIQNQEGFWGDIWDYCQLWKQKRLDNGALDFERSEIKLDISDPENITIKEVRENTPASMLIQELAILTNSMSAHFCMTNDLPCLYRNQKPYNILKNALEESEEGELENEKLTLSDIQIFPAYVSTDADGHSGLGLDGYIQATSPIRRFHDLINQTILLKGIHQQESGFSEDELALWAKQGEEIQREYIHLERALLEHWKIKYLAQHKDDIFDARKIRNMRNGRILISILNIQLNQLAEIDGISDNETFKVYIESIQPEVHKVTFRHHTESETI